MKEYRDLKKMKTSALCPQCHLFLCENSIYIAMILKSVKCFLKITRQFFRKVGSNSTTKTVLE
jgi:hypothetical protein